MNSATLEQEGRVWKRRALSDASLEILDAAIAVEERPGQRLNALDGLTAIHTLAACLLPNARPVRMVAFNKTQNANWTLPWHQDRVIALKERVETPAFENWTNKDGVWHAEPPIEFLQRMIFARVHLDSADPENGCLQLALKTHAQGRIAVSTADSVANAACVEDCVAERGDALFAKALILHRSSPSRTNTNRRAIRIDYCADPLPPPLEWAA